MARLLHTADWQIGKPFRSFAPDEATLLAEARILAVRRLAHLAVDHGVDAVIVAGDAFDAQTVADKTIHQLFQALAPYAGPWIFIPGNHDAALAESVWTRAQRLQAVPANVRLCLRPQVVALEAARIAVLPAPLTQRHTYADLTGWFDTCETPPGLARVGVAHGSVQGILAEEIDSANPIAQDRAERAQLDYLALGDWHGTRQINGRTWYSGTPETDRFRTNDSGNALLVDVEAGREPAVTVLRTGQFRWDLWQPLLAVDTDLEQLVERLGALTSEDVVQLDASGHIGLEGHRRLCAAIVQAQGRARALRANLDGLRLTPTEDDLNGLQADGYLADVIAELRSRQSADATGGGAEAQRARDALVLLANILDHRSGAETAKCD